MTHKIFIPGKFPSLNDYVDAERSNRYAGAKMKKEYTALAAGYFKALPNIDEPMYIQFTFIEQNSRRDPDNFVAFARKCILDGLQVAGKIPNDNMKWVTGWEDAWEIDKERFGVEVNISW